MLVWFNELVVSPWRVFLYPNQRTYWLYLLVALMMAAIGILWNLRNRTIASSGGAGPLRSRVFFRAFSHRSALVDYRYFLVGRAIFFVLMVPVLLSAETVGRFVLALCSQFAPPMHWLPPGAFVFSMLITLASVVVFDLSLFAVHRLFHRIPALWEFHKVHHSAEVLNPLTIYRIHPFEEGFTMVCTAFLVGTFQGALLFIFDPSVQLITIGHLNLFLFFFYFFGFNLRHSPAPISYKPFLERILISPAQHHIHHSNKTEHYDKNFGFMFAFWDRLFGSLVFSTPGQKIDYGLGGEEREYSSASRLLLLPILKNMQRIRGWLGRG